MQGLLKNKENAPSLFVTKRATKDKNSKKLVISPLKEKEKNFQLPDTGLPAASDAETQSESAAPTILIDQDPRPTTEPSTPAPSVPSTPVKSSAPDLPDKSAQLTSENKALSRLVSELQGKSNDLETSLAKISGENDDLTARNTTLTTQVASLQSSHAKQVEELQRRIAGLEKERRDSQAEKEFTAQRHEEALSQAMKEHTTELAKAKADFDAAASAISERLREAQQSQSHALEAAKKDQALELARMREEHTHAIETEHKKYSILAKEFDALKKEFDSRSRSHEKLNEMVEVTKLMLRNVEQEKDNLSTQLSSERETGRRLHALAETSQKDSAVFEAKSQQQDKAVETLTYDNGNLERQLFIATALMMKLQEMCHNGTIINVSIQEMWERVVSEKVPRAKWSDTIELAYTAAKPQTSAAKHTQAIKPAAKAPVQKKASSRKGSAVGRGANKSINASE